jgi:hypothetical protein
MVRDIISKTILVAQIFDINKMNGTIFPTPPSSTFQFGFGQITENKEIIPHIHKRVTREITTTSEFLYVIHGEMIIDILDEEEKFVKQIILKNNMALLQFIGGHKIEIKSGTTYFELKQGPYYGRDFDKYNVKF